MKRSLLIVLIAAMVLTLIACGASEKSNGLWPSSGLSELLPVPDFEINEISRNNSEEFRASAEKAGEEDFNEYVRQCVENGFSIEAEQRSNKYEANNKDGYSLRIKLYNSGKLEIRLEAPDSELSEAPATEPPATEPPATEPPATEPPATEPPATEPPATEAPVTEAPATEAPATEAQDAPADIPGMVEKMIAEEAGRIVSEGESILESVNDYASYKSNLSRITDFYNGNLKNAKALLSETERLSVEYYKEIISDSREYSKWDKAISDYYEIWDNSLDAYYKDWDGIYDELYKKFDKAISDASDEVGYSVTSESWSDMYGAYSGSWSDMYKEYSDGWSLLYNEYSDVWKGFFEGDYDVDAILKK